MRFLLTGVEIEGFRGINNEGDPLRLTFKGDAVNSIFAPNGAGKSSIFDALCYVFKGGVRKLDSLPAAEQSSAYYANQFHSGGTSTVSVSLHCIADGSETTIEVKRLADGTRVTCSPSGHPDPEALLRDIAGESTFLDEDTFRRFIADTPLARGRSFAALVGLERLSETRQALEVLANARNLRSDFELETLKARRDGSRRAYDQALQRIKHSFLQFAGREPANVDDAMGLGAEVCLILRQKEIIRDLIPNDDLETVDFAALRAAIREAERADDRTRLSSVIQKVAALEALSFEGSDDLPTLESTLGLYLGAVGKTKGVKYLQLQKVLAELLNEPEWTAQTLCPACLETPEVPVRETVARALAQYQLVTDTCKDLAELWANSATRKRLALLEASPALESEDSARVLAHLDGAFRSGVGLTADLLANVPARIEQLERRRSDILKAIQAEKDAIEASLPASLVELTTAVEQADQIRQALNDLGRSLLSATAADRELTKRVKWGSFVTKAKDAFAGAEVALSTARVQALEASIRRVFSRVMGHDLVVPGLQKRAGTEELYLRLEQFFGSADLSAASLLSESYRNAFAVSIFLSAAQEAATPGHFIVLDDVTSSFDAGHQFNLMEVIRTELARPLRADGPQVVIFSHDGLLQKYFDSISDQPGWYHQRLKGSAPRGMVFVHAVDGARIRGAAVALLTNGDVESSEPLVRQYLEQQLLNVIQKVRIPVPVDFAIRDDRKMVANCVDAITTAVDLNRRAGSLVLTQTQIDHLTGVCVPSVISNWVSHYATGALGSFAPPLLLGVLNTVDDFVDCFRYDCTCGGAAQKKFYKNLASRGCGCH